MRLDYPYRHYREEMEIFRPDFNDRAELSRKLSKGEKLTPQERLKAISYNNSQREKRNKKNNVKGRNLSQ